MILVVYDNTLYALDFQESVHCDTTMKVTNKMQLYRLIYYFYSALRDLDNVFEQSQEQLTVFTVSGSIHPSGYRLVSWLISKSSKTPASNHFGVYYQIL